MKLQPDRFDVPSVNAYGPGWIAVNGERHERSFMLSSQHGAKEWPCARFEDLSVAHFEQLAALGAEIVLLGSGRTLRFPKPEWLQPLVAAQTGVETMDTDAACRTYNILAGEGRQVAVGFILG